MAKKINKIFLLKKSKVKKLEQDYGFVVSVMIDSETGRTVPALWDKNDDALVLVRDVKLDFNGECVQGLVKFFESYYMKHPERKDEMAKDGLRFTKDGKLRTYPSLVEGLSSWKLCIDSFDMALYLYAGAGGFAYYNTKIILGESGECADLVRDMLCEGLIYMAPATKLEHIAKMGADRYTENDVAGGSGFDPVYIGMSNGGGGVGDDGSNGAGGYDA